MRKRLRDTQTEDTTIGLRSVEGLWTEDDNDKDQEDVSFLTDSSRPKRDKIEAQNVDGLYSEDKGDK